MIRLATFILLWTTINITATAADTPQLAASSAPIGTVLHSVLDADIFTQLNGEGWILMAGQDITGTKLHMLTDMTHVPDARGVFLRGRNFDRAADTGNPDGDQPTGTYQSDEASAHAHLMGTGSSDSHSTTIGGANKRFAHFLNDGYNVGPQKGTHATGGNETRPRNISLNIYIRVD